MRAYSQDLRERVIADCDLGMTSSQVAAKYRVSRAWVHRLVQRRRETGEVEPRVQAKFRGRCLDPTQEDRLRHLVTAQPDRTLAELRDAAARHWLEVDRPEGPGQGIEAGGLTATLHDDLPARPGSSSLDGHDLIIGVDRLDYSKGLRHRVKAFATFLERSPEAAR